MAKTAPVDHLVWRTAYVGGRKVNYGLAGAGRPVLFLHGWALGRHAYKRSLKRLVRLGCQVYAPALPGFSGSSGLSALSWNLADYGAWVDGFLDAVGIDEPVLAIGHSFGGGVATKLAHDFPQRVDQLVLINSVGAGVWPGSSSITGWLSPKPLIGLARSFPREMVLGPGLAGTVSALVEDAVPSLLTNPLGFWKAGFVARYANLLEDLGDLKASGKKVVVIWGEGDVIIPRSSFDAICAASGAARYLVPGSHSWLLGDPEAFAEVMERALEPTPAPTRLRSVGAG